MAVWGLDSTRRREVRSADVRCRYCGKKIQARINAYGAAITARPHKAKCGAACLGGHSAFLRPEDWDLRRYDAPQCWSWARISNDGICKVAGCTCACSRS